MEGKSIASVLEGLIIPGKDKDTASEMSGVVKGCQERKNHIWSFKGNSLRRC